jgi:hypothetical protein
MFQAYVCAAKARVTSQQGISKEVLESAFSVHQPATEKKKALAPVSASLFQQNDSPVYNSSQFIHSFISISWISSGKISAKTMPPISRYGCSFHKTRYLIRCFYYYSLPPVFTPDSAEPHPQPTLLQLAKSTWFVDHMHANIRVSNTRMHCSRIYRHPRRKEPLPRHHLITANNRTNLHGTRSLRPPPWSK